MIGNSVTNIGDSAFSGCSSLTSVTIPDSVTSIGDKVFNNCRSLTSVTIGNSVKTINDSAFSGCSGLTSVTIGNSVTTIKNYVFKNCVSLSSITCLATTAPTVYKQTFGDSTSNYTGRNTYDQGVNILYVPSGATGYDTGTWADPLQNAEKCGFTISYTL